MKKALIVLMVLQIAAGTVSFFMLLRDTVLLAVLQAALTALSVTLTAAVIVCLSRTEDTQSDIRYLQYRLSILEKQFVPEAETETAAPAPVQTVAAPATWECIRCGAVNKPDTDRCSGCGAAYSLACPTSDPGGKTKVSRWIKK